MGVDIYHHDPELKAHILRTMNYCKRLASELSDDFDVDIELLEEAALYHDIVRLDEVSHTDYDYYSDDEYDDDNDDDSDDDLDDDDDAEEKPHNHPSRVKESLKERDIKSSKKLRKIIKAHRGKFKPPEGYEPEAAILRISDKLDRFNKGKPDALEKYNKSMKRIMLRLKKRGYSERQIKIFKKTCRRLCLEVMNDAYISML